MSNINYTKGYVQIETSEGTEGGKKIIKALQECMNGYKYKAIFSDESIVSNSKLYLPFQAITRGRFTHYIKTITNPMNKSGTNNSKDILTNTGWVIKIIYTEVIPMSQEIYESSCTIYHEKYIDLSNLVIQSETVDKKPWTLDMYMCVSNDTLETIMNSTLIDTFFESYNEEESSRVFQQLLTFVNGYAAIEHINYQEAEYRLCKTKKFKNLYNAITNKVVRTRMFSDIGYDYDLSNCGDLQVFTETGTKYTLYELFGTHLKNMTIADVNTQLEKKDILTINLFSLVSYLIAKKEEK